ncbi:SGNH/GDSL hydrolase family protein [Shewanella gelidii]|uniref:Lipase n=1 Tax=Shewanella gelidii TaxID=1642821 RepID=A0A917JKA7_9GAMM|nr:SGNH/GDSL hydrolase family protein [Shewanella gelidii]MCL1097332.1 SGNH/GDSL hydrolase family protein [Shewanella gelidii]GGI74293.1 lipase [Shewanella gelidii]
MFYYPLQIALAPILLYQGKQVRKTALKLPEAAGARQGRCGEGEPLKVLIIGDSAAAGVGVDCQSEALSGQLAQALSHQFDVHWQLRAQSGFTTYDCMRAIEVTDCVVDVVVVSLGVNDVLRLPNVNVWMKHQSAFISVLRQTYQPQQIILTQVPPMGHFPLLPHPLRFFLGYKAKLFNLALSKWVQQQNDCSLLDISGELTQAHMAKDGFHPGPKIYQRWGRVVAQEIIQNRLS